MFYGSLQTVLGQTPRMSVMDLGASTDLSSVIKAHFNVQRNKGTSNPQNKETYWTIFTSAFYSSIIKVLQHIQCLSPQLLKEYE